MWKVKEAIPTNDGNHDNKTERDVKISQTNPDAQIYSVRNGVESSVTGRQGRYLRPIYDQIREHVKKAPSNQDEGAFFYVAIILVSSISL